MDQRQSSMASLIGFTKVDLSNAIRYDQMILIFFYRGGIRIKLCIVVVTRFYTCSVSKIG